MGFSAKVTGLAAAAALGGLLLGKALRSATGADKPKRDKAAIAKSFHLDGGGISHRTGGGDTDRMGLLSMARTEALTTEELASLSEVDRLAYFLARFAHDPSAAILQAYRLDSAERSISWKTGYGNWLLTMLMGDNPGAAHALVDQIETSESERRSLRWRIGEMARWNSSAPPEERLESILATNGITNDGRFRSALEDLTARDPVAALGFLERTMSERSDLLFRRIDVLEKLATAEPARFTALFERVTVPSLKRQMSCALGGALGRSDPTAGRALVASLPPSRSRSLAAVHLAAGWGKSDPKAAADWVRTELHGLVRVRALAAALPAEYVAQNPAEVVAMFRDLPEFEAVHEDNDVLDSRAAYTSRGGSGVGGSELDSIPTAKAIFQEATQALAETEARR